MSLQGVIILFYNINTLAKLAGVSSRTLRHYDQIGLLKPIKRSEAGYRLYNRQCILRLQQILFFKELGFSLDETKEFLDTPGFDYLEALEAHRKKLLGKSEHFKKLAALAQNTILNLKREKHMKPNELLEGFDYDKMLEAQKKHEPEVLEKWGDTDSYRESARRTKNYTKADWERIHTEQADRKSVV